MNVSYPALAETLRTASAQEHPWKDVDGAEAVGEAFAKMTHAFVDFIDAARAHSEIGYKDAVEVLDTMVHLLPATDAPTFFDVVREAFKASGMEPTDKAGN